MKAYIMITFNYHSYFTLSVFFESSHISSLIDINFSFKAGSLQPNKESKVIYMYN